MHAYQHLSKGYSIKNVQGGKTPPPLNQKRGGGGLQIKKRGGWGGVCERKKKRGKRGGDAIKFAKEGAGVDKPRKKRWWWRDQISEGGSSPLYVYNLE